MRKIERFLALVIVALALISSLVSSVQYTSTIPKNYQSTDIYAIWQEGERICRMENPYSRIHTEGFKAIYKPPAYLPGFYLLSCASHALGIRNFNLWMQVWNVIEYALYLIIGIFLFWVLYREQHYLLSAAFTLIWFFGRFAWHTLYSRQTNFLAILPLLASLLLITKRPRTSYLLFGLSLTIKQIGIFLLPLYLVWELPKTSWWKQILEMGRRLGWILILPFIVALPFLIDDHLGFFLSISYSLVREPTASELLLGLPEWLTMAFPGARSMPLILSLGVLYLAAYLRRLPPLSLAFLIMLCFVSFHAVLFKQYVLWMLVLIPLAVREWSTDSEK